MRLAILGTRGVPPQYGGFETFAAELGTRLVRRGHDVTIYSRGDGPAEWNGIRRVKLPSIKHKYLETVSHALFSAIDALRRDFDAVLVCNAANAFVLPLLRAARVPVAINVDGIERRRRKWNPLGRAVYTIGEALSASFATVVADAEVIADYYRQNYQIEPVTIPYGAEFPVEDDSDVRERLGVKDYILYVSRFEPENNALETVLAYTKLENAPRLVMVGGAPYAQKYTDAVRAAANDNVLFPGPVYGRDYRTLQRNALLYIQATEIGGTHPAMIEAMASGGAVLANDTPENREVGGDAVGYFRFRPAETLSGTLAEWLANSLLREDFRERARRRAGQRYDWERVTDAYERLFATL